MTGATRDAGQYVTLGIAREILAVPVARVHEILELRPIASLPQAPDTLLGLIDLRGNGVPVLDLRRVLDLPGVEDTPATRILVIRIEVRGRELKVGPKTDRVFEVTVLDDLALDAPQASAYSAAATPSPASAGATAPSSPSSTSTACSAARICRRRPIPSRTPIRRPDPHLTVPPWM